MPAVHIIQKQYYDITVANQQQGMRLQQQLNEMNLRYILPAIGGQLDELFPNQEVVVIDKLEINVGRLKSNAQAEEWVEKIIEGLMQSLRQLNIPDSDKQNVQIQKLQPAQHAIEVFMYFLKTGMMPSETAFASVGDVISALKLLDEHGLSTLRSELVTHALSTGIVQRLIMPATEDLFFVVKVLLPNANKNEWQKMLETIDIKINTYFEEVAVNNKRSEKTSITPSYIKNNVRLLLLQRILSFARAMRYTTMQELLKETENDLSVLLDERQNDRPESEIVISKENKEDIAHANGDLKLNEPQDDLGKSYTIFERDYIIRNEENKNDLIDEGEVVMPQTGLTEIKERIINYVEGFFVSNAGTCLVAPYLPGFFKQLKLCSEHGFYDKGSQQHAVYLLHYLATAETGASEEKLPFAKILCGWPLETPCVNLSELTKAETDEAEELLSTVIAHWSALKSTSPDGLREGFLQRGGKISEKDGHYLLQVEHKSLDVLLEQVPWTFRMIKLPWMKKMIHVEWY